MRIKQWLLAGFLFISILTLGFSFGFSSLVQGKMVTIFQEIGGKFLPGSIALSRMEKELYRTLVLLHKYEESPDIHIRREMEEALASLDTHKTTYDLYQKESELSFQIENLIQTFSREVARYTLLLQKEANREDAQIVRRRIDSLLSQFKQSLDPSIQDNLATSFDKIVEFETMNDDSRRILLAGGTTILFITFFLSLFIAHIFSRPLSELKDAVHRVSAGDLNVSLPVSSKHEIGELAIEFNQMAQHLNMAQQQLLEEQAELENRVKDRTEALQIINEALTESIEELNIAQSQLIETEKMAALGRLVSGVAHEINTPIGVSVTASSTLSSDIKRIRDELDNGQLKKSSFEEFLGHVEEGSSIIERNLYRASGLIRNFKQVAVDQSVEEIRKLDLSEYLNEILSSLQPKWKHSKVEVITDFSDGIEITTYPGALAQILTNLISNSLKHGFDGGKFSGEITIKARHNDDSVILDYIDSGKGMSEEILQQIFDPFFTTKRGSGGTGLGMHIVYNLVTQKMKGTINCTSQLGEGCHIIIHLPETVAG